MRTISTFLFIFNALLVSGQYKDIPVSIEVPEGCKLMSHTYAKGVQVYICTRDPKDSLRYIWTFKEPRAELYTDKGCHNRTGKHYFDGSKNPTWELMDKSRISGVKVKQAGAPDTSAIPWLLLKATTNGGSGKFKSVQFIQRIRTAGGKPMEIPGIHKYGQTLEVPYTAQYLFYSKK